MKILFLDIDGVLNSDDYFYESYEQVKKFYYENMANLDDTDIMLKRQMLDIDFKKLDMLKEIIDITGMKVVIISSWKKLCIYPYVEKKLIHYGIPIIGITNDNGSDRGRGIKEFIQNNKLDDYIILDDDIFDDYDDELLTRLVKTDFYNGGLMAEHKNILIKKLKNNNI